MFRALVSRAAQLPEEHHELREHVLPQGFESSCALCFLRAAGQPHQGHHAKGHWQIHVQQEFHLHHALVFRVVTRGGGQPPASDREAAAERIVAVLSSSEQATVRDGLSSNLGAHFLPVAGAGYKVLAVIDSLADAYVLSKGSTYKWDTCAPHAILRALGGGLLPFWLDPAPVTSSALEVTYH